MYTHVELYINIYFIDLMYVFIFLCLFYVYGDKIGYTVVGFEKSSCT